MKKLYKGYVLKTEQLHNSIYGNPRAEVLLKCEDLEQQGPNGEKVYIEFWAKTASNSMAGYCLSSSISYLKNREMIFLTHETKQGSIIIERVVDGYYDR